MSQNIYNDDNKYKDVINALNQLPKIKAPDNFEYNLMTRIHNKNFTTKSLKNESYTLWGFLKPALGVAATAVIIFFVMDNQGSDFENPFLSEPKIRTEAVNPDNDEKVSKEFIVSEETAVNQETETNRGVAAAPDKNLRVVLQDNDVIAEEKTNFPFPDNSIDLDTKLKENTNLRQMNDTRVLAGTGNERVYFEGFFTGTPLSRRIIDSLKQIDSLSRIQKDSSTIIK